MSDPSSIDEVDEQRKLEAYLDNLHQMAEVPLDSSKPIRLYARSADSVFKQACIYRNEQDLEKSFVLFLKFSNLLLKELPKHPEYKTNAQLIGPLRANLLIALDALESTKPILLERYGAVRIEQRRLAMREKEMELTRRREAEAKTLAERAAKNQEEARRQRLVEMQKLDLSKAYERKTSFANENVAMASSIPALTPTPVPPPKAAGSILPSNISPVSSSESLTKPYLPDYPSMASPPITPRIPQSSAKPEYFSENGMALRLVRIPQTIVSQFLYLAAENTRKNLETCGVLAGKLAHNQFTITALIMPKQTSTSDTVTMLNEEEIFEVQDKKDLLTLGWIHTHPTQQCFMSSVDLHTHFPYQLLIAEAVAIVVAPTQCPNYGVFRLTDPPGIGTISKCPQRGFHHHPSDQAIYREASGPKGHAKMEALPLEVVELRNKP